MKTAIATILFALFTAVASAAEGEDPFANYLFPPERVMAKSQEIGLEDAQKHAIRDEVQKVQPKFTDLQFELQDESGKMIRLLQEKPVDEARVLEEVDRILGLEKQIKKLQVSLLVRIKNILTPAQQAKLTEIQKAGAK
jgi:Spy/CpxP family protein refolding chaperone